MMPLRSLFACAVASLLVSTLIGCGSQSRPELEQNSTPEVALPPFDAADPPAAETKTGAQVANRSAAEDAVSPASASPMPPVNGSIGERNSADTIPDVWTLFERLELATERDEQDAFIASPVTVKGIIKSLSPNNRGPLGSPAGELVLEGDYFDATLDSMSKDLRCQITDRESLKGLRINQSVLVEGKLSQFLGTISLIGEVVSTEPPPENESPAVELKSAEEIRANFEESEATKEKFRGVGQVREWNRSWEVSLGTDAFSDGKVRPDVFTNLLKIKPLTKLEIRGPLKPEEFASFPEIQSLEIWGEVGSLDDELLQSAASLPRLQFLKLGGKCQFTPAGIAELRKIPTLRELEVSGGFEPAEWFDDAALLELKGTAQLRSLVLNNTGVTDEGLSVLQSLPALRKLKLERSKLSGSGLRHLGAESTLLELSLQGSMVDDAGIMALPPLKSLASLDLSSTRVTDSGAPSLSGFPNLMILRMVGTDVTSKSVEEIRRLSRLRVVSLRGTGLDDAGIEALAEMPPPRLSYVGVADTQVSATGVRKAASIKSLRKLSVPNSVDKASLKEELLKMNPNLKVF